MSSCSQYFGSPRPNAAFRIVVLLTILIPGLVATVPASAIPPASYSASVTPTTCEAQFKCGLTFTMINQSPPDSGAFLSEATIEAPTGFTINDVGAVTVHTASPSVTKNWTATAAENKVSLSADDRLTDALAPTESLSVPVDVTASLSTVGPENKFPTTATGFLLPDTVPVSFQNTGDDPSVTVVNDQVNCPATETCTTNTITLNNTSAQASASAGATNETLRLSVGGSFLDPGSKCLTSATYTPKGEPVTTDVTGEDRSHIVTLTLDKTVNNSPGAPGAERYEICVSADKVFVTKDGTPAEQNPETAKFEGLLPNCPPVPVSKCILSRSRSGGNTIIRYFVEPGDPIGIPGLSGT